jgi:hypothetical protein
MRVSGVHIEVGESEDLALYSSLSTSFQRRISLTGSDCAWLAAFFDINAVYPTVDEMREIGHSCIDDGRGTSIFTYASPNIPLFSYKISASAGIHEDTASTLRGPALYMIDGSSSRVYKNIRQLCGPLRDILSGYWRFPSSVRCCRHLVCCWYSK